MSYQTHICIQCVCVERGKKRLAAFSLAVKRKRTATVTGGAMKPWQHAKCWPTLRKWALCRSLGNQCKKRNTSPHTHENRLTNCWESAQPLATELWPADTPWRHYSNSRSAGIKHSSQWELQKWKKKDFKCSKKRLWSHRQQRTLHHISVKTQFFLIYEKGRQSSPEDKQLNNSNGCYCLWID